MKVFISYSSRDKWVARRISGDLNQRGIETFLDEKDIETGDSIDETIHKHLTECDELLMLLSPSALASHWVMLEIGGANALEKRLVPILMHVGANELPKPLSKGLARDLNDIEKYYDEVHTRHRADGVVKPAEEAPVSSKETRAHDLIQRNFVVGDFVQIPEIKPDPSASDSLGWVSSMDKYMGKVGRVTYADSDRTVQLDVTDRWWWAMDWLEPADPPTD